MFAGDVNFGGICLVSGSHWFYYTLKPNPVGGELSERYRQITGFGGHGDGRVVDSGSLGGRL